MKKAGGVPVKPKLTGVSHEWPPLWIPLRWTDSGSEPAAGEFGRGGFCGGRTERAGEERTSSAQGFGEDAVCYRGPRWSPVCDTIALLAPCSGSGERSTGEWMAQVFHLLPAGCAGSILPNKVLRLGTKTWHVRSNVPLVFAKCVSL